MSTTIVTSPQRDGTKHVAIRADRLSKSYGGVAALSEVSFDVRAAEIFAILGPNGAGKTTLLETLVGLRAPDEGSFTILGGTWQSGGRALRRRVGVVLQTTSLPSSLRVSEIVRLYADIFGERISVHDMLSDFGLDTKASAFVRALSGGQMQRLSIALSLIGRPEVLFVDEPTSALDPHARRGVWDTLQRMKAAGTSVVLTTHAINEAEAICDRVAIIDHGRIAAIGTPNELISRYAPEKVVTLTQTHGHGIAKIEGLNVQSFMTELGMQTIVRTSSLPATLRQIAELESLDELRFDGMNVTDSTLEDVFLTLTGREVRT
jgi:ABC-2 type transport system ATP-binding protein